MTWDTSFANYPGPHQANQNRWISALGTTEKLTVNAASTSQKFASKVGRYWSVRFALSDLGPEGVQVREFRLYRKGELITRNAPKPTEQPKTWSMGTRSGDIARTDWVNIKWHFESFMEFVNSVPGGRAVICVNLGLGTPEEGAEWVRYANKVKGYKIRDWQLGNENDGDWEEAGPLSSLQYTAKFLAFTKAMKAVDPTIRIHGPLHSSDEVFLRGDGVYSGQSWLQTFLKTVAAAERKDKKRYLDAMDFHTYPYWSNDSVSAFRMLAASARPGPNMDTLLSWMDQYLQDGKSRQVHMSEFSSTVIGTDKSLHAVQASVVNHIFAQFLVRAGNRGHVLPWDVYGGWQTGKDGTQGSIRLFNPATPKGYSSWDKSDPSSQWFGLHLAFQHWVREGLRVLPTTTADSAVRAFSLGKGDTTHVLLFNMSEHSMPVQISRKSQVSTPAQVFHFSAQNFQWIGSDDKAYAKPGMGPWANRFGATQSISIQIPPMGMALVNWDPKPLQSNEVEALHLGSNAKVLMPGDTFEFWGTLRQKGGSLLGGKFNCAPFAQGPLIFADNMSGGEMEGVYFRIPIPANTKPSTYSLKLEVEGTGQQGLAERIQFRVRGLFRTVLALINFDVVTPDSFGNGDNATVITPVVKHGPAPLLSWLQAKFFIEQPKGQNWPNFVSMRFYLDRKVINGVGIPGVPDSTRIAGIVFDYATRHSTAEGYFELQVLTDTVTDYDEFQLRLRKTGGSWVRDTVLWNQTKQEGWGKPVGQIDGAKIKALEFRARGEGSGEIDLNNIMLLAENGKEIPMPTELRRLR
jgi:hypothetical protein